MRTYLLTAGDVLDKVRVILNDKRQDMGYRNSDPELLGWLNDALNTMVGVNPGLFEVDDVHTCTAGYMQTVVKERAVMLIEVIGLPEADPLTLAQFAPGWTSGTPDTTLNWMRPKADPLRFMTHPPAVAGASLPIRYVKSPAPVATVNDLVEVPENYEPALVEYVAGRAEMQDDEHVNSGRASQLMDRFVASVQSLSGS